VGVGPEVALVGEGAPGAAPDPHAPPINDRAAPAATSRIAVREVTGQAYGPLST
jgi:hypothetical protein